MLKFKELWVLGHRIKPILCSGDFDVVEGITEYGVDEPPMHSHTKYSEFFYILEGGLKFRLDDNEVVIKQGESLDIPINIPHTFHNPSSTPCRWLNIHSPKGYMTFFTDMGVSTDQVMAKEISVSKDSIIKLLSRASFYDMQFKKNATPSNEKKNHLPGSKDPAGPEEQ